MIVDVIQYGAVLVACSSTTLFANIRIVVEKAEELFLLPDSFDLLNKPAGSGVPSPGVSSARVVFSYTESEYSNFNATWRTAASQSSNAPEVPGSSRSSEGKQAVSQPITSII